MMNIKRIVNLFFLFILSIFMLSACAGDENSYTVITPSTTNLYNTINGGTIVTDDNGNRTIVITNEDGEEAVVAYINDEDGISIDKNGEVFGYINDDGNITDTDGNVIGYIDKKDTIVITIISNNTEEETDTSEENNGEEEEENITITLNDDILSTFAEEFIVHFKANGNSITSADDVTTSNIEYILTSLANNGVDNVTSIGLASSFGRIVGEEVSDSGTCYDDDLSLGCALASMIDDSNALQSYFYMFLSQIGRLMFPSYYNTFTSIISNLANLNSQSDNISSLSSVLGDKTGVDKKQDILNQLSYAASYVAYTTIQLYCNSSRNTATCGEDDSDTIKIYTDVNTKEITIVYGGKTYILDQRALNDLENLVGDTTNNYSWEITDDVTTDDDFYFTYTDLYNNVGEYLVKICNDIIDYLTLHQTNYSGNSNYCAFTKEEGGTLDNLKSLASKLRTTADNISNNVGSDNDFDTVVYRNRQVVYYATYYTIYNNSISSLNTENAIVRPAEVYSSYYQAINTSQRNIYYFITEFINRLDNEGNESYLSEYQFKDGYTSKILPADMDKDGDGENDFYNDLALAFMTASNGTAISMSTLNTSTTASFTDATITNILNNTKEYVIDVLKTYGVLIDYFVSEFGKFYNENQGKDASDELSINAIANIKAIWTLLENTYIEDLSELDNNGIEQAIGKIVAKEILASENSYELISQLENNSEDFSIFLSSWEDSNTTNIDNITSHIGYILNTKETLTELAEYLVKYYLENPEIDFEKENETHNANLKSNIYYMLCDLLPYLTKENIKKEEGDHSYELQDTYEYIIPENVNSFYNDIGKLMFDKFKGFYENTTVSNIGVSEQDNIFKEEFFEELTTIYINADYVDTYYSPSDI